MYPDTPRLDGMSTAEINELVQNVKVMGCMREAAEIALVRADGDLTVAMPLAEEHN